MGQSLDLIELRLRNRRILVVEDEASTAVMTEIGLKEAGCRVHVAQDIRRAQKFARTTGLDCALLDIGIGDDDVFSVADVLASNNVPFIFSSGYDKDVLPTRYRSHVILPKPYLFGDVVRALVAAMNPANYTRPIEPFKIVEPQAIGNSDGS